jgi:hypothetical protein
MFDCTTALQLRKAANQVLFTVLSALVSAFGCLRIVLWDLARSSFSGSVPRTGFSTSLNRSASKAVPAILQ